MCRQDLLGVGQVFPGCQIRQVTDEALQKLPEFEPQQRLCCHGRWKKGAPGELEAEAGEHDVGPSGYPKCPIKRMVSGLRWSYATLRSDVLLGTGICISIYRIPIYISVHLYQYQYLCLYPRLCLYLYGQLSLSLYIYI